jgi:hypothetical protein
MASSSSSLSPTIAVEDGENPKYEGSFLSAGDTDGDYPPLHGKLPLHGGTVKVKSLLQPAAGEVQGTNKVIL